MDLLVNSSGNQSNNVNRTVIEPCVFCLVMSAFYLVALAFTVAVLSLVIAAKAVSYAIRFVLTNILIASFTAGLGILVINITRSVDTTLGHYHLSDSVCRSLLIFISVGSISRPLVMAMFAIVVYLIIKYSISAVKLKFLAASILVMWLVCGAFSLLLISPSIMKVVSNETTGCFPRSGPYSVIYTVPFFVCIIFIPFALNVVLLIASFWYVRANTVSENAASLKPMLKFSVFLLLGTLLSNMGHTTPVIAAYIKPDFSKPLVLRTINSCSDAINLLSIIPTPILVLVYFKPVRVLMKKCLLRVCTSVCRLSSEISWQQHLTERMLPSPID